ncbi:LRR domain containing protein [Parasponia andersonii]|uniref:LRR domain containing protein n=1 Tax=Parasponia andersonii TaxID=3476 RepID=A0A2P5CDR5_PARAD|nr:LRR domain containing protein [Parasponia andersonii]
MERLVELELDRTAIKELHSSIENLVGLQSLHLEMCRNLESLRDTIHNISCLDYISLRRCTKLRSSPDNNNSLQLCPKPKGLAASSSFQTILMRGWDGFYNERRLSRGYNYLQKVHARTSLPYSSQDSYDPTTVPGSTSKSGVTKTTLVKLFSETYTWLSKR